jgi:hypothetical protein
MRSQISRARIRSAGVCAAAAAVTARATLALAKAVPETLDATTVRIVAIPVDDRKMRF